MSHFLTGVYDDMVEEFHLAMVHDNMNIYCAMFHAQQVEDTRLKRNNRKAKKASS